MFDGVLAWVVWLSRRRRCKPKHSLECGGLPPLETRRSNGEAKRMVAAASRRSLDTGGRPADVTSGIKLPQSRERRGMMPKT